MLGATVNYWTRLQSPGRQRTSWMSYCFDCERQRALKHL